MRAALKGDSSAYFAALEALQPGAGEDGKMVLTIYLCKAVLHIQVVKHRNAAAGADASSDPLEGITEDYRQPRAHPPPDLDQLGAKVRRVLHSRGGRHPP